MHLRNVILLLIMPVLLMVCGCSTIVNSHTQKEPMMRAYMAGDTPAAVEVIQDKLSSTRNTGDELMWILEAGGMYFNLGKYGDSLGFFRRAESVITEYDERAIVSMRDAGSETIMAVTNLNALPYRGFCRDRIMLSVYKSLAYLGENNEDAFRAQVRRLRDEQKKVMEDYQKFFDAEQEAIKQASQKDPQVAKAVAGSKNSNITCSPQNAEFKSALEQTQLVANRGYGEFLNPLAIFLSGLSSIRDGAFDNAVIDFKRLYEAMPNNLLMRKYYGTVLQRDGGKADDAIMLAGTFDFPLDTDCVYVLYANGRSAAFRQIAIALPVMTAWPVCEYYPLPYSSLKVIADGKTYETGLLSDMDAIISREYNERLPGMITRIVISTAIKEAAHYGSAIAISQADELAGILVFIGGLFYKMAFNTADTRSWEILPKEFQLTQFPMPRDRQVKIIAGGNELKVTVPPQYPSAILYVQTPSRNVFNCNVLGFNSK